MKSLRTPWVTAIQDRWTIADAPEISEVGLTHIESSRSLLAPSI